MVVETGYPWRAGGWEGFVTNTAAMTWPVTPAGQAGFLRDVRDAVEARRPPRRRGVQGALI